jgi:large subunit ribosomal protein L24
MSAKYKIKKGDKVVVIAGKDKGATGAVTAVLRAEDRVIVEGVNVAKRHQKPTHVSGGGIQKKELPIHISNVALADPKSGKASRVGYKALKDGEKVRVAKKSGETVA